MHTDFLIIGQGLAGSLLAWELIQRDCSVVIVDNGVQNASLIAAGIINPVTGMRFVKTADVETLLPIAHDSYNQLSVFFKQEFYIDKPMLRILRNENELALCKKRQRQAAYTPYLGKLAESNQAIPRLSTPFGYIEQRKTGHLLTTSLLSRLKQFFIGHNCYRQDAFTYQAIQFDSSPSFRWQDITAKQLIFCEGHQGRHNPWFSWLPFQPVKGEILTLMNAPQTIPDAILNYGNWLIPVDYNKVRIGATFDRAHIDTQPSEQGKQTLLNALKPYSVSLAQSTLIVDHQAGIRPCTPDKYPFIGKHPNCDRITIFNGFGTKGSLQIPWYSQRFADNLLHNTPLPLSCDIHRFQTTYFTG